MRRPQTSNPACESVIGPAAQLADANLESACRKAAGGLALLFFLLYVPALASLSNWRGDERFYTDAAIGMQQSGDYLTPVYPDGSLRFKKPIVSYWAVLFGFKLFGFNYFAARLAFLAAGALVVWLCFELCHALTRRPPEALVATAIVASNLTMHNASIRSTPDMLLCLFVLASLLGFTHLLFSERRTIWYALAYLGAGLAVATKGLSGLLPVLYAFLYAAVSKRPDVRIRQLFHPGFMALALVIGGSWFCWVFSRYGAIATADFFGDQMGERFSGTKTYILANAAVYGSSFILQLLPWSLPALLILATHPKAVLPVLRQHRTQLRFAGGWILFLLVIFSCGNIQRTRYFLPAYPFLALFFAVLLLHGMRAAKSKAIMDTTLRLLFVSAIAGGIVLAVLGLAISSRLALGGIGLATVALAVMWQTGSWAAPHRLAAAASLIILGFSVNRLGIAPIFQTSAAAAINQRLSATAPARQILPMAGMDVGVASQIRVLSVGSLDPRIVPASDCDAALLRHGLLICTEPVLNAWQPTHAKVEPCATGSAPWKLRDYIALCRAPDRRAFLKSKQVTYYLVANPSKY